mmetsp:Transcript_46735/g.89250  ORF Transcript_46735/g.89250 Transcript_46735/m.89250 type:complete len:630 (+) Transcript_46735:135-2024(+)
MIIFVVVLVFFSHWMACLWRLLPSLEGAEVNWTNDNGDMHRYDDERYKTDLDAIMELYVASLYWSTMTVTTIGYGDVVPSTLIEKWFVVVVMLIGGVIFGYIIGAVSNVVQQTSAKENEHQMAMNDLKLFLVDLKLPGSLQKEIKLFFERLHNSIDVDTYHYYTDLLSPALKAKLLLYMNKSWIMRVPHFKDVSQDFIVQVAEILTRHLFPPKEVIVLARTVPREVFIVNKGIAAGNNRLFTVGHLIGSDALVQTYKTRSYSARAITYTECSRLDREQLFEVLQHWPEIKKRFRLLAIKAIFRDEVKAYCIAVRTVRNKNRAIRKSATVNRVVPGSRRSYDESGDTPPRRSKAHEESKIAQGCNPTAKDLFGNGEGGMEVDDDKEMGKSVRVDDLFNRSQRTDFYTMKLEALHPPTLVEKTNLINAASMVQTAFRKFRKLRMQREELAAVAESQEEGDEPPKTVAVTMGERGELQTFARQSVDVAAPEDAPKWRRASLQLTPNKGAFDSLSPRKLSPARAARSSVHAITYLGRLAGNSHQHPPAAAAHAPFGSLRDNLGRPGPAQVSKGSEGLERQLQQILFSQSQMMTFMKKQQSLYQNMKTELCEARSALNELRGSVAERPSSAQER